MQKKTLKEMNEDLNLKLSDEVNPFDIVGAINYFLGAVELAARLDLISDKECIKLCVESSDLFIKAFGKADFSL